ncbi:ComEA family DNA-binding protein [Nitrosomonas aestuarii]|uniref:Competence protein ComEA n=1 Tax=Nitrosomonas aestuarii TaxID=52441 RepID=A0A1I3Z011_9PROT|nr:helix-hairpin-helix domain-containing protein [Nitrosomonas aestuarii]PTN11021.1 competence protein ComEA [Nitrosomonas aestuarii]SFK37464.1 competence protein ComEA [Nitrosomonas aestuarii]
MKGLLIYAVLLLVFSGPAFAVVNINTATHAELEALQGIGPAKAKAIVEHREKNGMFASTESLIEVDGIGQGTMKQLESSITVGNIVDTETTAAMTKQ